jgi:hypothetical protein
MASVMHSIVERFRTAPRDATTGRIAEGAMAVFCACKKDAIGLAQLCAKIEAAAGRGGGGGGGGARILCVEKGSGATAEVRAFMRDPDVLALEYDLLIFSPSAQAGISITTRHVRRVYLVFAGTHLTFDNQCQLAGRVRFDASRHPMEAYWQQGRVTGAERGARAQAAITAETRRVGSESATMGVRRADRCPLVMSRANLADHERFGVVSDAIARERVAQDVTRRYGRAMWERMYRVAGVPLPLHGADLSAAERAAYDRTAKATLVEVKAAIKEHAVASKRTAAGLVTSTGSARPRLDARGDLPELAADDFLDHRDDGVDEGGDQGAAADTPPLHDGQRLALGAATTYLRELDGGVMGADRGRASYTSVFVRDLLARAGVDDARLLDAADTLRRLARLATLVTLDALEGAALAQSAAAAAAAAANDDDDDDGDDLIRGIRRIFFDPELAAEGGSVVGGGLAPSAYLVAKMLRAWLAPLWMPARAGAAASAEAGRVPSLCGTTHWLGADGPEADAVRARIIDRVNAPGVSREVYNHVVPRKRGREDKDSLHVLVRRLLELVDLGVTKRGAAPATERAVVVLPPLAAAGGGTAEGGGGGDNGGDDEEDVNGEPPAMRPRSSTSVGGATAAAAAVVSTTPARKPRKARKHFYGIDLEEASVALSCASFLVRAEVVDSWYGRVCEALRLLLEAAAIHQRTACESEGVAWEGMPLRAWLPQAAATVTAAAGETDASATGDGGGEEVLASTQETVEGGDQDMEV